MPNEITIQKLWEVAMNIDDVRKCMLDNKEKIVYGLEQSGVINAEHEFLVIINALASGTLNLGRKIGEMQIPNV
jgi:hypothetical protein